MRNDGILGGSRDTTIDADTLINTGALRAGERLGIATRGDILNTGALGGQRVTVRSGGRVVNAPQFDGLAASGGRIAADVEGIGIVVAEATNVQVSNWLYARLLSDNFGQSKPACHARAEKDPTQHVVRQ